MKKIYLCLFLLIGFQVLLKAQTCTEIAPVTVMNIQDLNTQIDLMEANSATESRTVVLVDFTFNGPTVYNSSATAILNRDIDINGPCKSVIKASNYGGVYLKGDVSWRLNNSKNVTIDGFVFRRTIDVGNAPLISLNALSHSNVIKNSVLMEYISQTTPPTPFPLTNSYSFLRINGGSLLGTGNIIDNCIFQNKYSKGNYVELINSKNVKILGSIFRESDTTLFTSLTLDTDGKPDVGEIKRYILSRNSENLLIEESSFSNKYSYWAYVQLNQGLNNTINKNKFYESTDPNNTDEPLNSTLADSQYKDYIKLVDEVDPSITSNDFIRKFSLGNYVNYAPTKDSTGRMTTIFRGTISDNKFRRKYQTKPSSMLRIGSCYLNSQDDVARTDVLVSNNTFEGYNYKGHPYSEIISNKASGNKYYNNEFINCYGSLRIRCGDDVVIKENKFIGNGVNIMGYGGNNNNVSYQRGIAISGKRHEIYNNYFKDLTYSVLDIYGGSLDESVEGSYIKVEDFSFSFNTIVNCKYNISFRKEPLSLQTPITPGHQIMAKDCQIENNIFYNDNSSFIGKFVLMDSDYDITNPDPDDQLINFSSNSFRNNVFYLEGADILNPPLITTNWPLPNVGTVITDDPILSYDPIDEIHKLTAASPNTVVNAAYDDLIEPNYIGITHDILGTLRGANKDIGCHEYDIVSRAASNTVALFENTNTKLQSYPNPVNDIITLTGVLDESSYVIYNINGVNVLEGTLSNNKQIKVDKLSKGMYFLTINNSETIKLIKN